MSLKEIVSSELIRILKEKQIDDKIINNIEIERPNNEEHGDFSTNIAMKLAGKLRNSPRNIAIDIKENFKDKSIKKIDIAGPGFINFYFDNKTYEKVLEDILTKRENYGRLDIGKNKKTLVEYISANPTGYLHVGHGRGAVVGDVLANILDFAGYDVSREYYLNDAGKQIDTLAKSIFLRYKQLFDENIDFMEDGYNGNYIKEIALDIKNEFGNEYDKDFDQVKDFFREYGLDWCIMEIKKDLDQFGINFDNWYSEKSLFKDDKVQRVIKDLEEKGFIYLKDGAKWFNTKKFGDDKDRVVVRDNGISTYYASDIAYHKDKMNRGFEKLINVWGADHHGYVQRVKAALEAMGFGKEALDVILVQIVNLYKDGEPFAMSKRTGKFITIRDLIDEIGVEASRMSFIMRSSDSQFDFDLEEAKKKSKDNPVYYIQYAYARSSSILRNNEIELDKHTNYKLNLLVEEEEIRIIKKLDEFPEIVKLVAETYEVHRILKYAYDLASLLHSFYNKHRVLVDDKDLSIARLTLIKTIRIVIKNTLNLIGVNAPEKM
ncbi:MAG: arginine--tRNA ligase [Fusobacteriota bacterium]